MTGQNTRNFELGLVGTMRPSWQQATLARIESSQCHVEDARKALPWKIPGGFLALAGQLAMESIREHLGPEHRIVELEPNETGVDSTLHCYRLQLWPAQWWVWRIRRDGGYTGASFLPINPWNHCRIDPERIVAGLWCRDELSKLADEVVFFDGWDEDLTYRFRFDRRWYEASFFFDLLMEWSRVAGNGDSL